MIIICRINIKEKCDYNATIGIEKLINNRNHQSLANWWI